MDGLRPRIAGGSSRLLEVKLPRRRRQFRLPRCPDNAVSALRRTLDDWAVASLPDTGTAEHGFTRWLLIRRSITNPADLAYYLCYGPSGTTDEDLIRVAGTRWAIEECFQTAKNEVGLDHYQVRRYDAWYRHI